jgi:predicted aspartyl protease
MRISGLVSGMPCDMVIDTGATITVMSKTLYHNLRQHNLISEYESTPVNATAANGGTMNFVGTVPVVLGIGGVMIEGTVFVSRVLPYPILVGIDFINEFKLDFSFSSKSLVPLGGQSVPFCIIDKSCTLEDAPLRISGKTVLPPRSLSLIEVTLSKGTSYVGQCGVASPTQAYDHWRRGVAIPHVYACVSARGTIPLQIANFTDSEVTIANRCIIAKFNISPSLNIVASLDASSDSRPKQ